MRKKIPATIVATVAFLTLAVAPAFAGKTWTADMDSAAPAAVSPALVPSGCIAGFDKYVATYDNTGHLVSSQALRVTGSFSWSTSGASVALNADDLSPYDGHTYVIDIHRWRNASSYVGGPGGAITPAGEISWYPNPETWYTRTSNPYVQVHFYDYNRPSVGGSINVPVC